MKDYKIFINFLENPEHADKTKVDSGSNNIFSLLYIQQDPNLILEGNDIVDIGYNKYITARNAYEALKKNINLISKGAQIIYQGTSLITILVSLENEPILDNISTSNVQFAIQEEFILKVENITFEKNQDSSKINVLIRTNDTIDRIIKPIDKELSPALDSFYLNDLDRGSVIDYTFIKNNNSQSLFYTSLGTIKLPEILLSSKIVLNISGNSIIIRNLHTNLDLSYSLDGVNWFKNNKLNSLNTGFYKLYVKDEYDSIVFKEFSINQEDILNSSTKVDYFRYSLNNPVPIFKSRGFYDKLNRFNLKDCENFNSLKNKEYSCWDEDDTIYLQIECSYKDLKLVCDGVDIFGERKTNNIGLKESYTIKTLKTDDGLTGVYLTNEEQLNYETGQKIKDIDFGGEIPSFAKIGNIVQINGNVYKIDRVDGYDEDKDVNFFYINKNYNKFDNNLKLKINYNKVDFDIYEFSIKAFILNKKSFKVFYNNKFMYESVEIKTMKDSNLFSMYYYSKNNKESYFGNGFKFFIRFYNDYMQLKQKTTNNYFLSDNNVQQNYSKNNIVDNFILEPTGKKITEIFNQAFSNDVCVINNVYYVKESLNIENLKKTSLSVIKASMLLAKQGNDIDDNYELLLSSSEERSSTQIESNGIITKK